MDISGSHRIPAPRSAVWAGLKDPDVLRECVPGCERLERGSGEAFEGVVAAKIGPLKTVFSGRASVESASPPERFAISVTAADATAGSGEGRAEVTLTEEDGATVIAYAGSAEVEGKIAQLGSRLVSGVARQTVETFFARFAALAEEGRLPAAEEASSEPPLADAPPLAPEQPAAGPAEIVDAPPLVTAGEVPPGAPTPIAPTATPDTPDPAVVASAHAAAPAEGRSMSRIMLVAAIVVAAGVALYFLLLQPPA
ncbi:CoxG family protein [Hansschlegelia zhihuaiae]|uniref:Carbon monoxide dehydrogenase n=1 Tax=Hansschlegelia zhihuaiae TaxID=405005 RepID=A0A4Q0M6Q2_9HYPH|nr:carbon monoxide dehydrogenase subunit G [Hansschlegelia zhihuaiae]RXF68543.1 carbon monoxide dehydrogenase [Hansschlegelia zhihuaiae]